MNRIVKRLVDTFESTQRYQELQKIRKHRALGALVALYDRTQEAMLEAQKSGTSYPACSHGHLRADGACKLMVRMDVPNEATQGLCQFHANPKHFNVLAGPYGYTEDTVKYPSFIHSSARRHFDPSVLKNRRNKRAPQVA